MKAQSSKFKGVLFLFLLVCGALNLPVSAATTNYVDFAAGNDASSGTSTGTAWRTIPGTYNTAGSAYLNAAWGSITTSAKLPDNTTIKIKSGTTHDSANGGFVWITGSGSGYWTAGCTNLLIEKDGSWGSGEMIIDGTGMTVGIGLVLVQIDGLKFNGLVVKDSTLSGLYFKEKGGDSAPLTNVLVLNSRFENNGTSIATDPAGAAEANINVRRGQNVGVSNCVINGSQQFINGVLFGDNHKSVQNGWIGSCTITNHKGDLPNNDTGIGVKVLNSVVKLTNSLLQNNLKGVDGGEQAAEDALFGGANAPMSYKIANNIVIGNQWGVNFNARGASFSGSYTLTPQHYILNNLIASNGVAGVNVYASPFEATIAHNNFEANGFSTVYSAAPLYNNAHIIATPDILLDTNRIVVRVFNNIFRDQLALGGNSNVAVILNKWISITNDFTLEADGNFYKQSGANTTFALIGAYGGQTATFSFGANGPGHASGNWWAWYGNSTTPFTHTGTGHFNADPNSRGTGADVTNAPPFAADYKLTASYPGNNLSTQSWYIAEMGLDRNGVTRTSWDLGAYEFVPASAQVPAQFGPGISIPAGGRKR